MFSYYIVLVVRYDFGTLTACHLLFLRCLMHVKLNVIKLFNRLSLTANQNGATHDESFHNSDFIEEVMKVAAEQSPTAVPFPRQNQKFIVSSNFQLHEDDLSRIDVKSLVRNFPLIINNFLTKSKKRLKKA